MYLALSLPIVTAMLIACPKEVPTVPCKKIDQNGKCLDGAIVSEPTNVQPQQSAGMTADQMKVLLAALQTQQNTRLNSYAATPNQTIGEVYATEESYLVAKIQELETLQRDSNTSPQEAIRLQTTIDQHRDRLNKLREERKSGRLDQIWNYSIDFTQKNPDKAFAIVEKGGRWVWNNLINPLLNRGGEKECDPLAGEYC